MKRHRSGVIRPPPAGSKAVVEQHPNGFTITIPARGLLRGGGVIFLLALVCNGFTLLLAVNSYNHALTGAPLFKGQPAAPLVYLAPLAPWLLGLVLLLVAIDLGLRQAVLTVAGDRLLVQQTGLFRAKQGNWERPQLFAICAGPSDRLLQLEIYPKGRPQFTLLAGRPDAELEWLAAVLRGGLQLGTGPALPATAREPATAGGPGALVSPNSVMSGPGTDVWIGAGIFGAVYLGVLWLVYNRVSVANGVGFLESLGWPWSNI